MRKHTHPAFELRDDHRHMQNPHLSLGEDERSAPGESAASETAETEAKTPA